MNSESHHNVINDIINVIFLTSWKNHFFSTNLITIVVNMIFLLLESCYSNNDQFSHLCVMLMIRQLPHDY